MSKCFIYLFQCSRVQYDFWHYFVSESDARHCRILVKGWFLFSTESTESSVYLTITNVLYFLHNTFIVMPVSIHWLDSFCQRTTNVAGRLPWQCVATQTKNKNIKKTYSRLQDRETLRENRVPLSFSLPAVFRSFPFSLLAHFFYRSALTLSPAWASFSLVPRGRERP